MIDASIVFNAVDEFLEELERDTALVGDRVVARGIVRLGVDHQTFIAGVRLYVRASYVSDQAVVGIRRSVQLVELYEYAGLHWNGPDDGERAKERVDAICDAVRQTCERLGLECRSGAHRAVA